MKRMPNDWQLSREEISSEVNATFIKLIKLFVPKVDGLSVTSYCYKYAEKYTFQHLMNEYSKLKKQVSYEIAFAEKYESDDEQFKHQYGYYEIEPFTTIDKEIEQHSIIDQLLSIANPLDRKIMNMILNDLTYEQIGNKLKISRQAVSRRLKKYRNIFKK